VSLERYALSSVEKGWKRGLQIEADRGRRDYPPIRPHEARLISALIDGRSIDDAAVAYGSTIAVLERLAARGLIKPSDGRIEVTNVGHEAVGKPVESLVGRANS
jgi:DNA topoisomerase IA